MCHSSFSRIATLNVYLFWLVSSKLDRNTYEIHCILIKFKLEGLCTLFQGDNVSGELPFPLFRFYLSVFEIQSGREKRWKKQCVLSLNDTPEPVMFPCTLSWKHLDTKATHDGHFWPVQPKREELRVTFWSHLSTPLVSAQVRNWCNVKYCGVIVVQPSVSSSRGAWGWGGERIVAAFLITRWKKVVLKGKASSKAALKARFRVIG